MAIEFRGTPKIGSALNGGDVTLTFDTGADAPVEGDVVVLFGGRGNSSDATAWGPITSGYTAIATIDSTGPKFGVWYKVMGASPDTDVQGEGGGSAAHGVVYGCYVIKGNTIDPAIFDQTATSTGQVTAVPNGPSIVTQTAGALVVTHYGAGANDTSRGTVSGYTLIPGASVNETNDFVSEAAYAVVASPGTEDPPAWSTWSSSLGGGITIAFKPAAGQQFTISLDESVGAADAEPRQTGKAAQDAAALADAISRLTGQTRGDAAILADVVAKHTSRGVLEALSLADTLEALRILVRDAPESAVLVDALSRLTGRTIAEAVATVDTMARSTARVLADDAVLADVISRLTGRTFTGETATLADSVVASRVSVRDVVEALALADSMTATPGKVYADAAAIADVLRFVLLRTVVEAVQLEDAVQKGVTRGIAEAAVLGDVVTLGAPSAPEWNPGRLYVHLTSEATG